MRELARAHPGVVVLAVDAKNGFVATDGWTEVSTITAIDLVRALADVPIGAVLYTDVARDGTGTGPNVEATRALAEALPVPGHRIRRRRHARPPDGAGRRSPTSSQPSWAEPSTTAR